MVKRGALFVAEAGTSGEEQAAWRWLQSASIGLSRRIRPGAIAAALPGADIVWWHSASPGREMPGLDAVTAAALRTWLVDGGRLLLTLHAASLLPVLGLEDRPPDELGFEPWEHAGTELTALEGERRGLIGFGPHPVFTGLHGGVFLLQPRSGSEYPRAVYRWPTAGRLVAAEWQYLAMDAGRRLMLEHAPGSGRVLTVGAHLLFAGEPNPYRMFLERFARNCLEYLTVDSPAAATCYWPAVPPNVASSFGGSVRPQPETSFATSAAGSLVTDGQADAQFDLTGRRIVVLGRQRSGVTEIWSPPVRLARNVTSGKHEESRLLQVRVFPSEVQRVFDTFTQSVHCTASEAILTYEGELRDLVLTFEVDLRYQWPYPEFVLGQPRVQRHAGNLTLHDQEGAIRGVVRFEPGPDTLDVHDGSGCLRVIAQWSNAPRVAIALGGDSIRSTPQPTDDRLLTLETPDPGFNEEFSWAVNGLRAFDVESPVGRGLLAGLAETGTGWWSGRPGYAWYFGRDTIWSSFGCLGAGMHDAVRGALWLLARYRQLDGKILHELTPSGVAHFDAADSTPLFLVGLDRYLRWSGDRDLLIELWPAARRALAFAESTDRDGDGLIENTGVGHGWSEGGQIYGAHATFYLNACWAAALDSMTRLARLMKDYRRAHRCQQLAGYVRAQLNERLFMPAERWFAFGIAADGSPMTAKTIEPAVAATFQLLDDDRVAPFFDALASPRFTAPWGVRYIANDDPAYHPRGYHHGSVWPLFTGWAATAEYAYGRPDAAFGHIRSSLALVRKRALGAIDEVLDGDDGTPVGVCPHQLWSHAMTVMPVVDGLLGVQPDVPRGRLTLRPQLPRQWDYVRVRNLRVGSEILSFSCQRTGSGIDIVWDEPPPSLHVTRT